jgi:hypothetical protein
MAEKHAEHGLFHGEPIYHGLEDEHDKLGHALLADREWIFAAFIRLSAWTLVLTFLVLAFLALTQT